MANDAPWGVVFYTTSLVFLIFFLFSFFFHQTCGVKNYTTRSAVRHDFLRLCL
ncbi:hypothetical protein HanIR_Chr11g0559151 [Helianthus annuus]|nr:hypothetical protein HanIR_Chr11g0559151 [Helianthus annuus]